MAQPILEAHGLVKQYGSLTAVDEVSFFIEEGEIFGLYGPNGAGKSTTTALLTGMLPPDKGAIRIFGCDAVHEAEKVKHLVGIVPQELSLYPTLNARDNLRFFGEMYQLSGARLHERIEDVLQYVSMTERAGDPVRSLAGGMKRRLNFAVGLINRPRILFLDEPTAGADPQSSSLILESAGKLNQEQGITLFYTTNDPEEARRLCHRVAIIDQGKIIAVDTPNNLIAGLGGGIIIAHLVQRGSAGPDEICRSISELGQVQTAMILNQAAGPDNQPGEKFTLKAEVQNGSAALMAIIQRLQQLSIEVAGIETLEPNLESVYMHHTGKSLQL